jgi:hypothetical protein
MRKPFEIMNKVTYFFGRGIRGKFPEWVPLLGGKGWKLWPLTMLATFILLLVIADWFGSALRWWLYGSRL